MHRIEVRSIPVKVSLVTALAVALALVLSAFGRCMNSVALDLRLRGDHDSQRQVKPLEREGA